MSAEGKRGAASMIIKFPSGGLNFRPGYCNNPGQIYRPRRAKQSRFLKSPKSKVSLSRAKYAHRLTPDPGVRPDLEKKCREGAIVP